jgi:hypothetical protein
MLIRLVDDPTTLSLHVEDDLEGRTIATLTDLQKFMEDRVGGLSLDQCRALGMFQVLLAASEMGDVDVTRVGKLLDAYQVVFDDRSKDEAFDAGWSDALARLRTVDRGSLARELHTIARGAVAQ